MNLILTWKRTEMKKKKEGRKEKMRTRTKTRMKTKKHWTTYTNNFRSRRDPHKADSNHKNDIRKSKACSERCSDTSQARLQEVSLNWKPRYVR